MSDQQAVLHEIFRLAYQGTTPNIGADAMLRALGKIYDTARHALSAAPAQEPDRPAVPEGLREAAERIVAAHTDDGANPYCEYCNEPVTECDEDRRCAMGALRRALGAQEGPC